MAELTHAAERLFQVLDKHFPRGRAELLERSVAADGECEPDLLLLRCVAEFPAKRRESINYQGFIKPIWVTLGGIVEDLDHAMAKVQHLVDARTLDGKLLSLTKLADAAVLAWFRDQPDSDPTAEDIAAAVGISKKQAGIVRNTPTWKLYKRKAKAVCIGDANHLGCNDEVLDELAGEEKRQPVRRSRKRAPSVR